MRGTFGRVGPPGQFWPPDLLSKLGDPGQHQLLRLRDDRGPREGLIQLGPEVPLGEELELEQGEKSVFEEEADGDLDLLAQSPGPESETEDDADSILHLGHHDIGQTTDLLSEGVVGNGDELSQEQITIAG